MRQLGKVLGGILLVSGTTIGAGMLALPVSTGMAGFIPSVLLFLVYWLYMTFTAFLFLEVSLWMKENENIMTMAKHTLGVWGQVLSWVVYLFLLYCLTTAYIAGSGPIFFDLVETLLGISIPIWTGSLFLLFVFGFVVYKGTHFVDYVNRLLMLGLVIAYFALIFLLSSHVELTKLAHIDWGKINIAVSIVATSFGFHIIIPSLVAYFDRDVVALRKVILIGSVIPLIVYILWEFLALGIIPLSGPFGIIQGYNFGSNGAHLLSEIVGHSWIGLIAQFFSIFAMVTSFLGVSLSLFDFLSDGFKIKKTRGGRCILYLLTFLPPFMITLYDPRAFLSALEYAGAFGVVLLLGLLPALMVWWGRYKKNYISNQYKAPGGKFLLFISMLLSISIILIECLNKLGVF